MPKPSDTSDSNVNAIDHSAELNADYTTDPIGRHDILQRRDGAARYAHALALPHRMGMLPEDLSRHLAAHGHVFDDSIVRRLMAHSFTPEGLSAAATRRRHPVARRIVETAVSLTDGSALEIVERVTDPADQFVKYLLRSPDGALHEAVRIPLHKQDTYSVCLSSQVGCAMQCTFCATGRLGLKRSMAAWEMVAAFLTVRAETIADGKSRVTGAVFQGQGEPFHNYDEVIQAARILSHPCVPGVSGDAITISTVGLVPQIRRYARERHPYRLIVSLTSALASRRAELLPVAGRFSLEEVASALREYASVARGRVTVAWVLIGGVNDSREEADALAGLVGNLPLRINLIDVNDARPDGYRRATDEERSAFMSHLQRMNVPIVRRYSGGAARHAACGMLASVRLGEAT